LVKKRASIALFGGSFDPPHKGHQAIVRALASLEDIDRVVVMPAYLNPFKHETLADAATRLRWCQTLCEAPRVTVSDFEITQGRPVYTIETVRKLQEHYDVKYLVIGADNLKDIEQWQEFEQLDAMVVWLVFGRGGVEPDCHKLTHCRLLPLDMPISSTEIRAGRGLEHLDPAILDEVKEIRNQHKEHYEYQRES